MRPDHVEIWYDRHVRSWVIQLMDHQDNQIGEAQYTYTKPEAKQIGEDLCKEHNLVLTIVWS